MDVVPPCWWTGRRTGYRRPHPCPLSQRPRLVQGAGLATPWPARLLCPSSAAPRGADGVTHGAGSLPGPTAPLPRLHSTLQWEGFGPAERARRLGCCCRRQLGDPGVPWLDRLGASLFSARREDTRLPSWAVRTGGGGHGTGPPSDGRRVPLQELSLRSPGVLGCGGLLRAGGLGGHLVLPPVILAAAGA